MSVDVNGRADIGVSEVTRNCWGTDSLALEHGGEEVSELVWPHAGNTCLLAELSHFFGDVVWSG